ncbi:hypothetical protein F4677DRAFT_40745 [Hypoxylon crocopeplum]|nr:hypothetical protein F4677DRAFT_40745 [Hypoxylon crocopeplum]
MAGKDNHSVAVPIPCERRSHDNVYYGGIQMYNQLTNSPNSFFANGDPVPTPVNIPINMRLPHGFSNQPRVVEEGMDTPTIGDNEVDQESEGTNYIPPTPSHLIISWNSYPPRRTPNFDIFSRKPIIESTAKGLQDVKEITDSHIEQSAALQEWLGQATSERKSHLNLEGIKDRMDLLDIHLRTSTEAPDPYTRTCARMKATEVEAEVYADRKEYAKTDRALLSDIQETYHAFVDIRGYESHASARNHALETTRKLQPTQQITKVESLLGSDGSLSTTPTFSTGNQLYFLGDPLKLAKIPFDKALAAGLEQLDGTSQTPPPPTLPDVLQPGPPQKRGSVLGASFPLELSPTPSSTLQIPDWFPVLDTSDKLYLEGTGLSARWNSLLQRIDTLEKRIEDEKMREMAKKPTWDKEWHDPSPRWKFPHQRKNGGWWKCRSGPDAPDAERMCHRCHYKPQTKQQQIPKLESKEELGCIMDAVTQAMGEIAQKDKAVAREILRMGKKEDKISDAELWKKDLDSSEYGATAEETTERGNRYSLLRGYEDTP